MTWTHDLPPEPAFPSERRERGAMSDDELTRLFDAVRADHVIDVMQPGLLACTCGERLAIVYGDDGAPRYNPAIRHHHEQYAAAVGDRLAAAEAREAALREAVEGFAAAHDNENWRGWGIPQGLRAILAEHGGKP